MIKSKEDQANNLYHNLFYDWDAELNELHGEDLWKTPNSHSRKIRRKVVEECIRYREKIKELSWWRRLFNLW